MFTLSTQAAKIAHLNVREEKHGEEDVLAVDVKLQADVSNDFLSELHPKLKFSLFDKPETTDLAQDETYRPHLRFANLDTLRWTGEIIGGSFMIHMPVSRKNLVFTANVKGLRLTPKEGGSVAIEFTAQINPESDQVAKLATLLGKTVDVSVEPPKAEAVKEDA